MSGNPATTPRRSHALDAARGLAILAMIAFHLIWDLANFGYISRAAAHTPAVKMFGHSIAIAFLVIVGVSLVLARAQGADWRRYGRRILIVCGAAALVSAGTYAVFPQTFVFFGILHCIALASLLAAPLLLAPWPAALIAGLCVIVAPLILSHPIFDAPALTWIGLSTVEPATNDYRPLLPWAGYVFLGVGAARFWRDRGLPPLAPNWKAGVLSLAGRHSLAIYLLHQPLMFALFYAAAAITGAPAMREAQEFLATCEARCLQDLDDAALCHAACVCTANEAGAALATLKPGDEQGRRERLDDVARACLARERR